MGFEQKSLFNQNITKAYHVADRTGLAPLILLGGACKPNQMPPASRSRIVCFHPLTQAKSLRRV
jgi:hypothetical protein